MSQNNSKIYDYIKRPSFLSKETWWRSVEQGCSPALSAAISENGLPSMKIDLSLRLNRFSSKSSIPTFWLCRTWYASPKSTCLLDLLAAVQPEVLYAIASTLRKSIPCRTGCSSSDLSTSAALTYQTLISTSQIHKDI